jgi:hypothetical protein
VILASLRHAVATLNAVSSDGKRLPWLTRCM